MIGKSNVADVEWIAKTDSVAVRINTLAPGQGTPWHYHSAIDDDVFCLEDPLQVGLRDPDQTIHLAPGQHQHIPAGRVHRVVNPTTGPLRYLLVQATGPYDFLEVQG